MTGRKHERGRWEQATTLRRSDTSGERKKDRQRERERESEFEECGGEAVVARWCCREVHDYMESIQCIGDS